MKRSPEEIKKRNAEKSKRWRERHPDRVRLSNQKQYAKNRSNHLARNAEWCRKNPQARSASKAKSYAKNRSKILKRQRAYRRTDRGRALNTAAYRAWCAKNKQRSRAKNKRWRDANPLKVSEGTRRRRARLRNAPIVDLTTAQWLAILKSYRRRCAYCAMRLTQMVTQDHVIPIAKGGSHTASNVVPACHKCNLRKKDHLGWVPLTPAQVHAFNAALAA